MQCMNKNTSLTQDNQTMFFSFCILLFFLSCVDGQRVDNPGWFPQVLDKYSGPFLLDFSHRLNDVDNSQTKVASLLEDIRQHMDAERPNLKQSVAPQSARTKRKSYAGSVVAFYAILNHTMINPGNDQAVVFDQLITDVGPGQYSTNTGAFTCATAGIYVFTWTVRMIGGKGGMSTELVKNGNPVSTDLSEYPNSGSANAIIALQAGDQVWVRVGEHEGGADVSHQYSMFSGYLLH